MAFVSVGVQHFTNTLFFIPIVPEILGVPEFWVYVSGLVEVILGIRDDCTRLKKKSCFLNCDLSGNGLLGELEHVDS